MVKPKVVPGDTFAKNMSGRSLHARPLFPKRLEAIAAIVKSNRVAPLLCGFSDGVLFGEPFAEKMWPDAPASLPTVQLSESAGGGVELVSASAFSGLS